MKISNKQKILSTIIIGLFSNIAMGSTTYGQGNNNSPNTYQNPSTNDKSTGGKETIFGAQNRNKGVDSILIGQGNNNQSHIAIVIGNDNILSSGERSISIGVKNKTSGLGSVNIGHENQTKEDGGVVIGYKGMNTGDTGVAIGMHVINDGDSSVALGYRAKTNKNEENVVSIGNDDYTFQDYYGYTHKVEKRKRKLIHMDKGNLNATSTDGINGSQLYNSILKLAKSIDKDATIDSNGYINNVNINVNGANYTNVEAAINAAAKSGGSGGANITLSKSENNLVLTGDEKNELSFKTDNVKFGNISINNGGKITGASEADLGVNSNDVVTGKQLFTTNTKVAKNESNISDINTKVAKNESNISDINTNISNISKNVTKNESNINNINETIKKQGDTITSINNSFNSTGIFNISSNDNEGHKVTKETNINLTSKSGNIVITQNEGNFDFDISDKISISNGLISSDSTQAVNGGQLFETNNRVTKNENDIKITNNRVTKNENDIKITNNRVTKNENDIKLTNNRVTKNENDIKLLQISVDESNISVSTNGDIAHKVSKNGVIDFSNTDKNIIIDNSDSNIKYNLADDLNIKNSINVAGTTINNEGIKFNGGSSVTNDGFTFTDGTTITNQGITFIGGTTITNEGIKLGDSNVTIEQQMVKYVTNEDGNIDYGKMVLEGENGTVISNVANGEISENSTEAINGSQLYNTGTSIAQAIDKDAFIDENGNITNVNLEFNDKTFGSVKEIITEIDDLINIKDSSGSIHIGGNKGGNSIHVNGTDGDRIISGVANGIKENDAVNVGQLYNAMETIASLTDDKINNVEKRLSKGIAAAVAMNIKYPEAIQGGVSVGAGFGGHGADQAIAIGGNYTTDSGNVVLDATVGRGLGSGSKTTYKTSVGYRFF